jgi:hypothetical protein
VASAATNNDRPACIVIELRLFVLVIITMLPRLPPTANEMTSLDKCLILFKVCRICPNDLWLYPLGISQNFFLI